MGDRVYENKDKIQCYLYCVDWIKGYCDDLKTILDTHQ